MQIELGELIRALDGAHNALLDLEELNEKDLGRFRRRYEQLAVQARNALRTCGTDTDSPFIDENDDDDGGKGRYDTRTDTRKDSH